MLRDRFAPRTLAGYFDSLLQELAQTYRSGFYLADDLHSVTEVDAVVIAGTIACEGGIRIEVEERLRFVREPWWLQYRASRMKVELVFYRYNAVLLNRGTIFRYNSPHTDHRPFHHVHRFDVLGTGTETVTPVEERDVPSLRQVLQEAEAWYWKNVGG